MFLLQGHSHLEQQIQHKRHNNITASTTCQHAFVHNAGPSQENSIARQDTPMCGNYQNIARYELRGGNVIRFCVRPKHFCSID
jgi:hypothetical protein